MDTDHSATAYLRWIEQNLDGWVSSSHDEFEVARPDFGPNGVFYIDRKKWGQLLTEAREGFDPDPSIPDQLFLTINEMVQEALYGGLENGLRFEIDEHGFSPIRSAKD